MFRLKFALNFFRHQLKAINRHGLHSPFVYRLVDKVIYDKTDKKVYIELQKKLPAGQKLTKAGKLLCRIIADARPSSIWILGVAHLADVAILEYSHEHTTLKNISSTVDTPENTRPDIIFLDLALNTQTGLDFFNNYIASVQNNTLLIVKSISENELTRMAWYNMQASGRVSVTVNLFFFGLIYFRTGQVKEHFFIKW